MLLLFCCLCLRTPLSANEKSPLLMYFIKDVTRYKEHYTVKTPGKNLAHNCCRVMDLLIHPCIPSYYFITQYLMCWCYGWEANHQNLELYSLVNGILKTTTHDKKKKKNDLWNLLFVCQKMLYFFISWTRYPSGNFDLNLLFNIWGDIIVISLSMSRDSYLLGTNYTFFSLLILRCVSSMKKWCTEFKF